MAQHSYIIPNASGASFRSEVNKVLDAIKTNNSGIGRPTNPSAYQIWTDETTSDIYIRNGTNTKDILIGNANEENLGIFASGPTLERLQEDTVDLENNINYGNLSTAPSDQAQWTDHLGVNFPIYNSKPGNYTLNELEKAELQNLNNESWNQSNLSEQKGVIIVRVRKTYDSEKYILQTQYFGVERIWNYYLVGEDTIYNYYYIYKHERNSEELISILVLSDEAHTTYHGKLGETALESVDRVNNDAIFNLTRSSSISTTTRYTYHYGANDILRIILSGSDFSDTGNNKVTLINFMDSGKIIWDTGHFDIERMTNNIPNDPTSVTRVFIEVKADLVGELPNINESREFIFRVSLPKINKLPGFIFNPSTISTTYSVRQFLDEIQSPRSSADYGKLIAIKSDDENDIDLIPSPTGIGKSGVYSFVSQIIQGSSSVTVTPESNNILRLTSSGGGGGSFTANQETLYDGGVKDIFVPSPTLTLNKNDDHHTIQINLTDKNILDSIQSSRGDEDRGKILRIKANDKDEIELVDLPSTLGGGGTVSTDATISGDGSSDNPLTIVNPFTDADESKLDGIAAGAEVNVQSDWTETTATSDAFIKNKPTLSTVATSGSYVDLTNKPTIPTLNDDAILDLIKTSRTQSDRGKLIGTSESSENELTFINVPEPTSGGGTVATDSSISGDGSVGSPLGVANPFTSTEKTKLSGIAAGAEVNVQSDWTETTATSDAFIKNKPTLFDGDYDNLTNKPTIPILNDDAILDLAKSSRVEGDRGKFLGISATNEDDLVLLDGLTPGSYVAVPITTQQRSLNGLVPVGLATDKDKVLTVTGNNDVYAWEPIPKDSSEQTRTLSRRTILGPSDVDQWDWLNEQKRFRIRLPISSSLKQPYLTSGATIGWSGGSIQITNATASNDGTNQLIVGNGELSGNLPTINNNASITFRVFIPDVENLPTLIFNPDAMSGSGSSFNPSPQTLYPSIEQIIKGSSSVTVTPDSNTNTLTLTSSSNGNSTPQSITISNSPVTNLFTTPVKLNISAIEGSGYASLNTGNTMRFSEPVTMRIVAKAIISDSDSNDYEVYLDPTGTNVEFLTNNAAFTNVRENRPLTLWLATDFRITANDTVVTLNIRTPTGRAGNFRIDSIAISDIKLFPLGGGGGENYTLTQEKILDAIKSSRETKDRGKLLAISSTNEDELSLIEASSDPTVESSQPQVITTTLRQSNQQIGKGVSIPVNVVSVSSGDFATLQSSSSSLLIEKPSTLKIVAIVSISAMASGTQRLFPTIIPTGNSSEVRVLHQSYQYIRTSTTDANTVSLSAEFQTIGENVVVGLSIGNRNDHSANTFALNTLTNCYLIPLVGPVGPEGNVDLSSVEGSIDTLFDRTQTIFDRYNNRDLTLEAYTYNALSAASRGQFNLKTVSDVLRLSIDLKESDSIGDDFQELGTFINFKTFSWQILSRLEDPGNRVITFIVRNIKDNSGITANQSDDLIFKRGIQERSTILENRVDVTEESKLSKDDLYTEVKKIFVDGDNTTVDTDDSNKTLAIDSTASGGSSFTPSPQTLYPSVAPILLEGDSIKLGKDPNANRITINYDTTKNVRGQLNFLYSDGTSESISRFHPVLLQRLFGATSGVGITPSDKRTDVRFLISGFIPGFTALSQLVYFNISGVSARGRSTPLEKGEYIGGNIFYDGAKVPGAFALIGTLTNAQLNNLITNASEVSFDVRYRVGDLDDIWSLRIPFLTNIEATASPIIPHIPIDNVKNGIDIDQVKQTFSAATVVGNNHEITTRLQLNAENNKAATSKIIIPLAENTVADGAITTIKLADSAVTTGKLNTRAVTITKLASTVTLRLLPSTIGTAGQVLQVNSAANGVEYTNPSSGTEIVNTLPTSGIKNGIIYIQTENGLSGTAAPGQYIRNSGSWYNINKTKVRIGTFSKTALLSSTFESTSITLPRMDDEDCVIFNFTLPMHYNAPIDVCVPWYRLNALPKRSVGDNGDVSYDLIFNAPDDQIPRISIAITSARLVLIRGVTPGNSNSNLRVYRQ